MSTIVFTDYTGGGEAGMPSVDCGLAAPGQALLRPARKPAPARLRPRAVAGAVPRAAPHRARPARRHGPARGNARLRQVECHRARGPSRVPRSRSPPGIGRGPSGEGPGPHPHRHAVARDARPTHVRASDGHGAPLAQRASRAGPDSRAPARLAGSAKDCAILDATPAVSAYEMFDVTATTIPRSGKVMKEAALPPSESPP